MAEYVQTYPGKTISAVTKTIAVESKKEVVVEVTTVQKEERRLPTQIIPEMKVPQSVRERDDDWFLLLGVVPRETSYVAPGTHSLQTPVTLRSSKGAILKNEQFVKLPDGPG